MIQCHVTETRPSWASSVTRWPSPAQPCSPLINILALIMQGWHTTLSIKIFSFILLLHSKSKNWLKYYRIVKCRCILWCSLCGPEDDDVCLCTCAVRIINVGGGEQAWRKLWSRSQWRPVSGGTAGHKSQHCDTHSPVVTSVRDSKHLQHLLASSGELNHPSRPGPKDKIISILFPVTPWQVNKIVKLSSVSESRRLFSTSQLYETIIWKITEIEVVTYVTKSLRSRRSCFLKALQLCNFIFHQ